MMNTIEQLRWKLIRHFHHFNNPATWLVESPHQIPLQELFLPAAREKLRWEIKQTSLNLYECKWYPLQCR